MVPRIHSRLPSLHIDISYQEDMRGSEGDSFNSFNSLDSSSEECDQNRSFQEVLTRKKAKKIRKIEYNGQCYRK